MSTLIVDKVQTDTIQDEAGAFEHARLVQVVNVLDGAVATGTTAAPYDDTIPQNTEGDEYMTLAITPTNTNNKLKIEVVIYFSNSSSNELVASLFQDSTANALAAGHTPQKSNGELTFISFAHYMTAGTVASTTFKVRAGAASGTTTFNGYSGARKLGGVASSSITISEIRV